MPAFVKCMGNEGVETFEFTFSFVALVCLGQCCQHIK